MDVKNDMISITKATYHLMISQMLNKMGVLVLLLKGILFLSVSWLHYLDPHL